ncbi:forkhead box protein I2-like [Ptychodera flava]|uniref:forkhead box protein I2-like n=1 Tax=Ptychodera flava TaxID=63121 RepID=UPI00396A478F
MGLKNFRGKKSQASANMKRPTRSFSSLIYEALKEKGPMNVSEIYNYLQRTYPYFKTKDSGNWKNSIRHNLSLNEGFKKGGKGLGKGHLWQIDPDVEVTFLKDCVKPPKKPFSKKLSSLKADKEVVLVSPNRRRTLSFTRNN